LVYNKYLNTITDLNVNTNIISALFVVYVTNMQQKPIMWAESIGL